MADRALRSLAHLTVRYPVAVLVLIAACSILLGANVGRLQLRTDLTDLVAGDGRQAELQRAAIRELGYGNQFFVIVQAPGGTEEDAERMEAAADALAERLRQGGCFTSVRSGMTEQELLEIVRLFSSHFPAFADPAARDRIVARLSPEGVREHVREAAAGLLTPFGTMGSSYFTVDPLGVMEFVAPEAGGGALGSFDMEWGSGGRFFSHDHRALLLVAEPRLPASDYEFSVQLVRSTGERIREVLADSALAGAGLQILPVGAQVYAEQNRRLIQDNLRLASSISVVGNLLLLVLVYRWLPAILLTVVPTGLALLWTAGAVAFYPGVVNLVSLAFVAILAGLGDDQVTYFFSRVPEESARGVPVEDAITTTYLTTGRSVLFCVLTTSTGTLALSLASFRALAELGMILTVGLLMLAVHTLVTVPALISLLYRYRTTRMSGSPFRVLPAVADRVGALVTRRPRLVLALAGLLFAGAVAGLPGLRLATRVDAFEAADALGLAGQRLLSERFGMEGAPTVFLLDGPLPDVLERAGRIEATLRPLRDAGVVRSVVSPSTIVPSPSAQERRRAALAGVDFGQTAAALQAALEDNGLVVEPFRDAVERVRVWGKATLTLEEARRHLPGGLLDGAITKLSPGRYLAAVSVYSGDPAATATLPAGTVAALERRAGPLVEFSYDRVGRDLQARLMLDSRHALAATLAGVVTIVFLGFRRLRPSLLVLAPIAYGLVVTFGLLALAGHRFSGMAFSAVPLILGIGIDNGIHLVRRYHERRDGDVRQVLSASGPALIQTNLTTMVGFGALMVSSFRPLGEMGLITAVGVGSCLLASLVLIPAALSLARDKA